MILKTKERHPHPLLRLDAMGTIAITTCGDLSWHSEHAKNTEKDTYRIKLEKELYVSSHSRIIRGDHSRLGRVAIKVVKPSKKTAKYVATESQQGRWKTEMEAMWYLDHVSSNLQTRISTLINY